MILLFVHPVVLDEGVEDEGGKELKGGFYAEKRMRAALLSIQTFRQTAVHETLQTRSHEITRLLRDPRAVLINAHDCFRFQVFHR